MPNSELPQQPRQDELNEGYEIRMRVRQAAEFQKPRRTVAARMYNTIERDNAHYREVSDTRQRQERKLTDEMKMKLLKARGYPNPDINLGYQKDDTFGMVETQIYRPRAGGHFRGANATESHGNLASKTNNFMGHRPQVILTNSV